ncbi:conserved hypothetical protein [Candidatus Desulfarcum epimagneticum]|uniref:TIGR04372 family glycosyltransferase n=1 Tax=uncultured Desulfobacteraceae bacterium TaxID=218296 RepID=A0A484HH08_9BACT|nr:conserved hypothetical protein [uncultured Desulfobacteraceae bacterium]
MQFFKKIHRKSSLDIIKAFFRRIFVFYPMIIFSFPTILLFYILSPVCRIKIAKLQTDRIGHLALNTEIFLRKRQLGYARGIKHIFFAGKSANVQLLKMWRRYLFIVESNILYAGLNYPYCVWLWEKTRFFEPLQVLSNEYQIFQEGRPALHFTLEEEEKGEEFLHKMRIAPDKDWFVCIFSRDSVYLDTLRPEYDWKYHDDRNADIDSFIPAIKYIIDKGGYVFRMGYKVNKPVNFQHERFIDYAVSLRDDFMDIYLMAKCRFVIGSPSGITDVPVIFDRPKIGVNWVPYGCAPIGKNSLYIPKKLKNRNSKQFVSFKKFLHQTKKRENTLLFDGKLLYENGYEYEDNTEQEILEATQEMFARLEGKWKPTIEDQKLLEKYFQAFPEDHWSFQVETPIGLNFLKKHRKIFL